MMPNLRPLAAPPGPRLRAIVPTFAGPLPITVAGKVWMVPRGSKVVHPSKYPGIVYVIPFGKDVRCLCARGEVPIPPILKRAILARYFPD